ncbi:cell wall hydrolase [Pelotomaculum terephthalicicum JT]|uniref:cell wall hydrolase n=1 Tax=Pelotomaculum TaxID=191373 RepID=UPI001F0487D2|nr:MULTISPECIES: cell wall hydrolase [Pelotomaculum]MCG9968256.1 cell wall hydrolase [Pelotomaculum terephthalicicum JT]
MMKWRLSEKLSSAKKLMFKEKLNKKVYFLLGLFLIPLSLALHPVTLFKTLTGPVKKEQQATALLPEQGLAARPGEENSPASEGEGGEVSRGGDVSRSDVVLLAQVIEGEAAEEPYSGKVAVGAVIMNRTESPDFPKTIPGVIYERDAFESVSNGQYLRPVTAETLQAASEAVNGNDPVGGALYFWNPAKSSSEWVYTREIITRIGGHVFAR